MNLSMGNPTQEIANRAMCTYSMQERRKNGNNYNNKKDTQQHKL